MSQPLETAGKTVFHRSKRADLLRSSDVRRWHDNTARGAQVTADVYLRRLRAFCEQSNRSPKRLLSMKEMQLRNLLLDFIGSEEKKGRAPSYISSSVKAVKSWLTFNGIALTVPVKIHGADTAPTLRNEQVPTLEGLHRVFLGAAPRDRVVCSLMAHSGLRPEVLGNYKGTDGVRLGDFEGLKLERGEIQFEKVPAFLTVRQELSKLGRPYLTLVSSESCDYIVTYLNERASAGEDLATGTDLVHPVRQHKTFLTSINVSDAARGAIRRAGFSYRPYNLRAFFDTRCLLAESEGKVAHDYRVFWMGHKGSIDARYTTNKGRLPEDLLEDMRRAYARVEEYLTTSPSNKPRDMALEFRKAILAVAGVEGAAADKVASNEEALEILREKLLVKETTRQAAASSPPHLTIQRPFPPAEAERLMENGWRWVAERRDGQIVLEAPGSL